MTESASSAEEVDQLGLWFDGAWLEDVVLADGVVTGSFEQSVFHHGEPRPELPPIEEIGSTRWYEQLKVPVVACTFAVRHATALEFGGDLSQHPVFGVEWVAARRCLEFDHGAVVVRCDRPNLEVEASDYVAGYVRLRRWRIGGLETSGAWQDD